MKKNYFFFILLMLLSINSCKVLNKYDVYSNFSSYQTLPKEGIKFQDNVEELDISWTEGTIVFQKSEESKTIFVSEESKVILDDKFKCHIHKNEGKLSIQYVASDISYPSNLNKNLYISVPEDLPLDSVVINNVAASITLSNLVCKSLEVNNVSGNVVISGTKIESFTYIGTSGNLNFKANEQTSKIKINQDSGNTDLLIGKSFTNYEAKIKTLTGNVKVFDETKKSENHEGDQIFRKGEEVLNTYFIESVSGSINISYFAE